MAIASGSLAPDFELIADNGVPWKLSSARGKKVLLVFYPGDDTLVCTAQLCDYRDGIESFRGFQTDVVGISMNDKESHQKFKEKYDLPFPLLSDPDHKVAAQYGCMSPLGTRRGVYLIDEKGIIRYGHVELMTLFKRSREELLKVLAQIPNREA
ncbi:MAG TPA: peroxiredoxin [Leptospiraceae bacterium]|jgi:peroxiredoxin Q/BCP|nr:peroxiredoxin [Leptospirales bacterium]HMU83177.1 peroxiredoxin [Leptospiraceae bacterium]HMW58051.1 peroxiredoxin [Leptospiraceae bacterium]HMX57688.1 peroxiredoxin [Leptospiraceae bacterium]HMY45271.1 peroxiredoxin [Leptospiraceae bacterium]